MHALSTDMNDALHVLLVNYVESRWLQTQLSRQSSVVWIIFVHQCLPEIEKRTFALN